jgi:hypothetical protein
VIICSDSVPFLEASSEVGWYYVRNLAIRASEDHLAAGIYPEYWGRILVPVGKFDGKAGFPIVE